jgi:Stigma-specific protein, Stig1
MDPVRFDRLTRALGVARSRRGFLGALVGVAALWRPGQARAQGGMNPACPGCWAHQTCMAGGTACCSGSVCPGPNGTEGCCPTGYFCCGIGCCVNGEICVTPGTASVYRVCGAACPPNRVECGDQCCAEGLVCEENQCESPCPPTTVRCAHGLCCGGAFTCENGWCVLPCPPGTTRCGGSCCTAEQVCGRGDRCVRNCPMGETPCGDACCSPGWACINGGCRLMCGRGEEFCNGQCWPACPAGGLRTPPACGCRCAPNRPLLCSGGRRCVPRCPGITTLDRMTCQCTALPCPPNREKCAGRCVDVSSDNLHCGRCGNRCPAGGICRRGACVSG